MAHTLDDAPSKIVIGLQETLVELIDLSLQAKQAHWTIIGPSFLSVHELLDRFVNSHRDWLDAVAERMTAIGVAPDGRTATVAGRTPITPMPEGALEDHAVVRLLAERIELVAARIRTRMYGMSDDLVTQGLLTEIVGGLEKQLWILGSQRT